MKTAIDILNESDPILREIYAAGWDRVIIDQCTQEIILVGDHVEKRINKNDLAAWRLSYCTAILVDGTIHRWVKKGDGSCDRLRKLIQL